MSLTLGRDPDQLTVRVTTGAAWWSALVNRDGAWPSDAVIALVFDGGPTWTTLISGADATWSRTAADVAALTQRQRVDLTYTTGGQTILWARGRVNVQF